MQNLRSILLRGLHFIYFRSQTFFVDRTIYSKYKKSLNLFALLWLLSLAVERPRTLGSRISSWWDCPVGQLVPAEAVITLAPANWRIKSSGVSVNEADWATP